MIYFIQDASTGLIKIGHAADAWKRLANMQTGCPGALTMLALEDGGEVRERELHACFETLRSRGEWFLPGAALTQYVSTLEPAEKPEKSSKTQLFWNGLTAAELSRRTGLSRVQLCEIQNGKYRATPEKALRIQRACGKSAIELIFGDDAEEAARGYQPAANDAARAA